MDTIPIDRIYGLPCVIYNNDEGLLDIVTVEKNETARIKYPDPMILENHIRKLHRSNLPLVAVVVVFEDGFIMIQNTTSNNLLFFIRDNLREREK
ncbi:MAG: hypothetical protein H8D23_29240 [Candidatus Brocadiales bacterium]|nr:hypothetical protein [Candidatus Brocadiales bacterium]